MIGIVLLNIYYTLFYTFYMHDIRLDPSSYFSTQSLFRLILITFKFTRCTERYFERNWVSGKVERT